MDDNIAIKVQGVSKTFKDQASATTIKHSFIELGRKIVGKPEQYKKKGFTALKDISFEVKKGEFFGIVGRNGSGKSTLLKMIAGVYSPTSGNIQVNGQLTPFIELGVGFNPELTGKDNVYLNSALLGFTHKQTDAMYKDIVEFAELEQFMDTKLKNYSSGMQVRLAFSVAIRAKSDILLIDEVLAVGDEAFQRKCYEYFATLKKNKKTVLLVTHDMSSVERFCNKAIIIDDKKILEYGRVSDITRIYRSLNEPKASELEQSKPKIVVGHRDKNKNLGTIETELLVNGKRSKLVKDDDSKLLVINNIKAHIDLVDVFFGITITKDTGEPVFWHTTEQPNITLPRINKGKNIKVIYEIQNIFGEGKYNINVSVKSNDRTVSYVVVDEIIKFTVGNRGRNGWMYHPSISVSIE